MLRASAFATERNSRAKLRSMPDVIRAVCPHDCPDTCAMLVTVEDGRAVRMAGDPDHPVTQGFLCTKVAKYLERTYHDGPPALSADPRRARRARESSAARRGTRRSTLIATRLRRDHRLTDGPQAILPYSYAGTMGLIQGESMDRRFFHRIGASLLDRTICASAGARGAERHVRHAAWAPTPRTSSTRS